MQEFRGFRTLQWPRTLLPELFPILESIHNQIDHRAKSIHAQKGTWRCCKGCDNCCRQLASIPTLTEPEWLLLRDGFNALADTLRSQVAARVEALSAAARPLTCPFLDSDSGSCLVDHQRPIACRTYGYYVERDLGLYCEDILSEVEQDLHRDVIWGNAATIETETQLLGPAHDLVAWFQADPSMNPRG